MTMHQKFVNPVRQQAAAEMLPVMATELIAAHRAAAAVIDPVARFGGQPKQCAELLAESVRAQAGIDAARLRFADILLLAGISQSAVADALGVDRKTITKRIRTLGDRALSSARTPELERRGDGTWRRRSRPHEPGTAPRKRAEVSETL